MHAKIHGINYTMHGGWRLYGFPKPYSALAALLFLVFLRLHVVWKNTRKTKEEVEQWPVIYGSSDFKRLNTCDSYLHERGGDQIANRAFRNSVSVAAKWQRVDKYLWKWNLMTNYMKRWEKYETHLSFFRLNFRSALWIEEDKDCSLLGVDRHVMAGTTTFQPSEGTDYLERNCVVGEPRRLCIYDRVKGKILKTVDSVYQAIDSREDCEDLCNTAPFRYILIETL